MAVNCFRVKGGQKFIHFVLFFILPLTSLKILTSYIDIYIFNPYFFMHNNKNLILIINKSKTFFFCIYFLLLLRGLTRWGEFLQPLKSINEYTLFWLQRIIYYPAGKNHTPKYSKTEFCIPSRAYCNLDHISLSTILQIKVFSVIINQIITIIDSSSFFFPFVYWEGKEILINNSFKWIQKR